MPLQKTNTQVEQVREFAATENSQVVVTCAKIEEELSELDDDERAAFLEDMGISQSGLDKLIRASYALLNLISFISREIGRASCRERV